MQSPSDAVDDSERLSSVSSINSLRSLQYRATSGRTRNFQQHGVQTERSGLETAVSMIIDVSGDGKEVSQGALLYLVVVSSRGGLGGLVRLNTKASHTIAQGPIFDLEKVCTATDAR